MNVSAPFRTPPQVAMRQLIGYLMSAVVAATALYAFSLLVPTSSTGHRAAHRPPADQRHGHRRPPGGGRRRAGGHPGERGLRRLLAAGQRGSRAATAA